MTRNLYYYSLLLNLIILNIFIEFLRMSQFLNTKSSHFFRDFIPLLIFYRLVDMLSTFIAVHCKKEGVVLTNFGHLSCLKIVANH